jgi:hypothetical protein
LDDIAKAGGGRRAATASDLLQEKYNFKVGAGLLAGLVATSSV